MLFHAFLNAPREVIPPLVLLALHVFLIWRYLGYYRALFAAKPMPE